MPLGRDPRLLAADHEDVTLTCGEGVVDGILDVNDVEASIVTLTVSYDTNTTHVVTAGDHGDGTGIELDEVGDLTRGHIDLNGVVHLDQRVGETNTSYMSVSSIKETTSTLRSSSVFKGMLHCVLSLSSNQSLAQRLIEATERGFSSSLTSEHHA